MKLKLFTVILCGIALNYGCANRTETNNNTDQPAEEKTVDDPSYVDEAPDILPEYPGGDYGIIDFIRRNIVYPEKATANYIQGKVVVRFVVDTDGNVTNPEVISSVHPLLDEEAVRAVGLLKGFTPGMKDGVAVNTWYIVPITFRLTRDATSVGQ